MFIQSFLLAISTSIDSLGIGITYGIKNTKISHIGKIILLTISFSISSLAIGFGNIIKNIFSPFFTKLIGSFILIGMGLFIYYEARKKENSNNNFTKKSDVKTIYKNMKQSKIKNNEQKVYHFFIKFLGITIKIIKDPISSDLDKSNSIDSKEALFLGLALSLDSFCIGIGSSIIGINSTLSPILVSCFQLIFISIGNFIGRKLYNFSKIPDNIWSILSSILLILIGICRLF